MTLGLIGSLLSIAAGVGAIVFIIGANATVERVEDRISAPIDRLDEQIAAASHAVSAATAGELDARLAGLVDQAASAEAMVELVTEHRLYSVLPVDTVSLETTLTSVVEQVERLEVGGGPDVDGATVHAALDEISQTLDAVEKPVTNIADSLRFWIRVSGLVFLGLSLWSLWAQVALARQGRSRLNVDRTS